LQPLNFDGGIEIIDGLPEPHADDEEGRETDEKPDETDACGYALY